jgi:diphthamide biosynthesis protein 3
MDVDGGEAVYDNVAFDDMDFDDETKTFTHACPCGDRFEISENELRQGETIAHCNDCSLVIRVVLDDAAKTRLGLTAAGVTASIPAD